VIAIGAKAVQGILLVIFGALLWGLAAPFRAASVPEIELPPPASVDTGRPTFARYAVIGSRNLFQVRVATAALVPIEAPIEATRLPYRLEATITATRPELATALIGGGPKGAVAVSVGDEIEEGTGITVAEISGDRVVLLNQGVREALNFTEPESTRRGFRRSGAEIEGGITFVTPPPVFEAVASADMPSVAAANLPSAADAARALRRNDRTPETRPAADRLGTRPAGASVPEVLSAAEAARIVAGLDRSNPGTIEVPGPVASGEPSPFVAIAGEPLLRELRGNIPLADGEQVIEVNGIPVADVARLPELIRSIARERPSRVKISTSQRADKEIEVDLQ
jgi:hypothetical protein